MLLRGLLKPILLLHFNSTQYSNENRRGRSVK